MAILFVATFIRSAFGFGEALIAVPLLAFIIPIEEAAPVVVLMSITIAALIIAQDWRQVHLASAGKLFAATVLGTPLGLWMLTAVDSAIVTTLLAGVIILFSGYCLSRGVQAELKDDRYAWGFGFLAGALGGAYGMSGPPLVIYGALRRWSPQHFRATLQGYFLPASILTLAGYALTGLWNNTVTHYYLWAVPPAILACVLGRVVNRRMKGPAFLRWVHLGLIAIGILLLARTLGG
ncbi:sulfite exporter TauE/SafE family protein [Castellaniella sp.]|uniref:sulfite exporter TauE/SafE family protein n=1 Tax=Castellaniella sp. TaxID=1955812 RepID=UPI002AFFD5FB|nr:sulfite exporter TauE/SafE family protein [Castellaniella sp.]